MSRRTIFHSVTAPLVLPLFLSLSGCGQEKSDRQSGAPPSTKVEEQTDVIETPGGMAPPEACDQV